MFILKFRSFRWKFNNSGETLDVGKERHYRNGSTSVLQYTPISDQVSVHSILIIYIHFVEHTRIEDKDIPETSVRVTDTHHHQYISLCMWLWTEARDTCSTSILFFFLIFRLIVPRLQYSARVCVRRTSVMFILFSQNKYTWTWERRCSLICLKTFV